MTGTSDDTPTSHVRAVVQRRYGGAETWTLERIDVPAPRRGQVRVRVEAAAIDRGTWHLMTGLPLMARLGIGLRRPRQPVPGRDLVGVVEAVGPGVSDLEVGDRVLGTTGGTLAESVTVDRDRLVAPPARLTPVQQAALPISGVTALQAVDAACVTSGDRVLVIGASGGVGHFAVQLAAAAGAEVTAVCSGAKASAVRSLGATHVIDRHASDPAGSDTRFDAVIDIAGGRRLSQQRRLLTPRGTIVFVGEEGGGRLSGGFFRPMRDAVRMMASRQRYVMLVAKESADDLARLVRMVDAGDVTPHVHRVHRLSGAADAMRALESGETIGKHVISMTP